MELSNWLIYSAVALISILSPGPAILLAVSNGVALGPRKAIFSSLGNVAGIFLLSGVAMLGLGAVLKTSALLFSTVKFVGAAYLIYLGVRQWRNRVHLFARSHTLSASAHPAPRQVFARGFLVAVTNPKAVLFFTALFPQFIVPGQPLPSQFLVLTGTFMFFSFCSLMGYAVLARSAKRWLSSERGATWFRRASGGAFMLLGAGMLRLKHNPG